MEEFIERLVQESVSDIIVSGYNDTDNYMYFHPLYERLFFLLNDAIYELYIVDGVINANRINEIKLWFDIDEDDQFSLMSIYSQAFKTEQEIKILQINYTNIPFSNMSIIYGEGEIERTLKLEPNNFFGFTFS